MKEDEIASLKAQLVDLQSRLEAPSRGAGLSSNRRHVLTNRRSELSKFSKKSAVTLRAPRSCKSCWQP